MNNVIIIGLAVIAIVGISAVLLTGGDEPLTVDNNLPPTEVTQEAPDVTTPPEPVDTNTIIDLALANPELETLVVAVQTAGLVETLDTAGPFTVFAPSDSAFAAVPTDTLDELLQPENIEILQSILALHVVSGSVMANALTDGMTVSTLTNEELTVGVAADGTVTIGGATVIEADISADNGVIHIIDTVITEPA